MRKNEKIGKRGVHGKRNLEIAKNKKRTFYYRLYYILNDLQQNEKNISTSLKINQFQKYNFKLR